MKHVLNVGFNKQGIEKFFRYLRSQNNILRISDEGWHAKYYPIWQLVSYRRDWKIGETVDLKQFNIEESYPDNMFYDSFSDYINGDEFEAARFIFDNLEVIENNRFKQGDVRASFYFLGSLFDSFLVCCLTNNSSAMFNENGGYFIHSGLEGYNRHYQENEIDLIEEELNKCCFGLTGDKIKVRILNGYLKKWQLEQRTCDVLYLLINKITFIYLK